MRFSWLLLFAILVKNKATGQCPNVGTKTETYTPADETKILPNPEKGFYQDFAYTKDETPSWSDWKKNDKTLVLAQYELSPSRDNSAIFKKTEKHLTDAKNAGIKVILRFKYTDKESGDGDASFDKIIKDIKLIKSLLQKPNASDAFLTLQVGFVGAYGEWAYSKTLGFQQDLKDPNFYSKISGGQVDTKKTEQRYTIAKTAFEALPTQKQIQMRQMNFRQTLCNKNRVCERVGIFNDCFMGGAGGDITKEESASNSGTFNTPEETSKLTKDGKKVLVGGEFCSKKPADGRALADYPKQKTLEDVKRDIKTQRFTFLNSGVLPKIMYSDSNKSTRNKVNNFLGYRFELVSGTFPTQIKSGGTYCATIKVKNTGATNLIYNRPVEVVFRSKNKKEMAFSVNGVDPTSWDVDTKDQSVSLKFTAANVPAGEYDVLLNLPDNSKTNRNIPEYRILMSNGVISSSKAQVNDLPSRYNKLTTVTVTP